MSITLNKEYQVQRGKYAGIIVNITKSKQATFEGKKETVFGDDLMFFRATNLKPLIEKIKKEDVKTTKPNS